MLTLKLGELIEAESSLLKLDGFSKEGKLEFKTTYKLGKIIKKLQPELQDFYEEKAKLLKKFGTEMTKKTVSDSGEESYVGTGEYQINDMEGFKKYFSELLLIEVELSITPLTLEELDSIKGLGAEDIIRLGKFIEGNEAAEEVPSSRKKISLNLDSE